MKNNTGLLDDLNKPCETNEDVINIHNDRVKIHYSNDALFRLIFKLEATLIKLEARIEQRDLDAYAVDITKAQIGGVKHSIQTAESLIIPNQ